MVCLDVDDFVFAIDSAVGYLYSLYPYISVPLKSGRIKY